ncbi:hypothetical protein TEA_021764 [Camellia sinensis var. sinensis]|uniref:Transmembrane protein n=1 Tax=Camellia sinensis var. sinensis TaxID=542762 RepID=A0A4S4EZT0_CAMSN|nr:hypothetical protein TEA_021764 [Camellia sinensis var. sinensis]
MDQHQPQEPYHSDSDSSDSIQSTIEYEELTLIAPKKKLNQEDALKFMLSVKITFGGKSEEYAELTQIMKDYRDRRSDINVVRSRIKFLFKEHPELVAGFNIFLPAGYEISVPIQKDYSVSNAVGVEQTVCICFHDKPDLVADFCQLFCASSNSMTTIHQKKLKRLSKNLKKSRILFYLIVFFLALSLVVAFGLGINLGFYLLED